MDYIRISASYLFNIKLDNKYLLVKSERRNQYQPIGGCYKYYPEAESFLSSIGAIPEKQSNGVDSLMDLRLLVPSDSLNAFLGWYVGGQDRETTYDRELAEELVSALPQEEQKLFDNIQTEKQSDGAFDVFFDEEKGIESIKPMDIVSVNLSPDQEYLIQNLCQHNSNFVMATEEEILNGNTTLKDNTIAKIGEHTKNILQPPFETMEQNM